MKTAIIYASSHGTTEKIAKEIQKQMSDNTSIFNLKTSKKIDPDEFDQIIIGGSIHAGRMKSRVKEFCKKNLETLLQKRIGLFMVGMNEKDFETEFNNAYPEELRKHSISNKNVGGEFLFEKMNFIEKAIIKKISGIKESVSKINDDKIKELVEEMGK